MNGQYLNILQDSLKKKIGILDEIDRLCRLQGEILAASPVDYDKFDQAVDDKDVCINQLNELDEGFELLYGRVREELQGKKEQYAAWIAETQRLITAVMDKSVSIQTQENRNRAAVERAFYRERQEISRGKRSMSVAMDYYRNMNNSHVVEPQYMDQKK